MVLALFGFGWLWAIFSSFFFWLDSTILGFISYLYDLLMKICSTSVLSQADIHEFANRIQMLLGIFMLFKVSFSLIMYVVNPDDFSDKSKGIGKLAQNTVISLVMLAVVPYIFNMAYKLQAMVLEDNTLAKLILGEGDEKDYISTGGDLMAYQVMIPFFQPDTSISELESCTTLYDESGFNDKCYKGLTNLEKRIDNSSDNGKASKVVIENYKNGVEKHSLGLTFRLNAINLSYEIGDDEEDVYVFNYMWPLTTVVGVVVCLLLINFCIDIAVRSIKLSFLQLISPIPIIAYMDPKSGKDGIFNKWVKMCSSTYLSLFVRLIALYFGLYIIGKVGNLYDNITGAVINDNLVKLFIIIGVLFFIKQLPKILESLGIKLDGDGKFTLNPLRKMENGMVGGNHMKKFNDAVGKLPMAPVRGVGTLGKKGIASIDSMKNGRGFRAGWTSQHGKLYDAYRKKKDELMPYDAEVHKNKIQGRNDFDKSHKDWARGRDLWKKVDGDLEAFNGENLENYKKVYKHQAFAESAMKVDKAKRAWEDAIKDYENAPDADKGEKRLKMEKMQKAYDGAKADHDIMRNRYTEDAKNEDALSRTKNSKDENNVSHDATSIHRHRTYEFSSSNPTPTSASTSQPESSVNPTPNGDGTYTSPGGVILPGSSGTSTSNNNNNRNNNRNNNNSSFSNINDNR